jgi:hypothetical protein
MASTPLTDLDLTEPPSSGCSEARLRYLRLAVQGGTYTPLAPEQLASTLLAASLLIPPTPTRPVA